MAKNYKKRWGDRKDGQLIRDMDPLHIIMPYLYKNKTDSEAFISERIDLTAINAYMDAKNAENPEMRYKLFQMIIAAAVKTFTLRPKMNRFIKGYRMYQRDELTVAFTVKKEFKDDAHEALAFVAFDEDSTLETIREKIYDIIHSCRSENLDNATQAMDVVRKMPRPILRVFMWFIHQLDFYGKLPNILIGDDPNHASIFLTNLGSIGLKAGYHHLSNFGTNSCFVVIGEKKTIDGVEYVDLGLTLDERIADGYYYSKTVKLLKYLLQHPELLELPANQEVDYE